MQKLDPAQYCALALRPIRGAGYAALPPELLEAETNLSRKAVTTARQLNRQLLGLLLQKFDLDYLPWQLPESVLKLYVAQLDRLECVLETGEDTHFSFSNDLFRKDLAILLHRLIPFGAEFANPYSGVARSLAFKAGPEQMLRFMRAVVTSRGIRPFLELHMHPEVKEYFNPAGWIDTFERLAEFLQVNPEFRGVLSTSWFLDPALEKVSPRLVYLREIPERCGATILFAGMDEKGGGALETSPTRRRLHESGIYQPRLFTRIWPRSNILQRRWRLIH